MAERQRFTLEELATATGMTPRNVRAYQTRGLISAPDREGRRSVYGLRHLRQLMAVQRARADGASLGLISGHLARGHRLNGGSAGPGRTGAVTVQRTPRRTDLARTLQLCGLDAACVDELVHRVATGGAGIIRRGRLVVAADLAGRMVSLLRRGVAPVAVGELIDQAARAALPLAELARQLAAQLAAERSEPPDPADETLAAELVLALLRETMAARLGVA